VEFLEYHQKLETGKFSVTFTAKTAQTQEELAAILNELPGAHKVWFCINYYNHYSDQ
jgi:hypothetical protein